MFSQRYPFLGLAAYFLSRGEDGSTARAILENAALVRLEFDSKVAVVQLDGDDASCSLIFESAYSNDQAFQISTDKFVLSAPEIRHFEVVRVKNRIPAHCQELHGEVVKMTTR